MSTEQRMLHLKRTALEESRVVLGAIPMTKYHQGGLKDNEDESEGKTFAFPNSSRYPIKTLKNYLSHLNPHLATLFQNLSQSKTSALI